MQTKTTKKQTGTNDWVRAASGKNERVAYAPNSNLLEEIGAKDTEIGVLEGLKSTRKQLPQEMSDQILARLSVPLPGLKIFEDEGLKELGEQAYARGNEIHIAKGAYSPHTQVGRDVLLHEAAHIVQQGTGQARGDGLLQDSRLESQADSGFVSTQGFSMPTAAQGAPVQGLLGLSGLRKRLGGVGHSLRETARGVGESVSRGVGNAGVLAQYAGGRALEGASWLGGKIAHGASEAGKSISRGVENAGILAQYAGGKALEGASWLGGKVAEGAGWLGGKAASGARRVAGAVTGMKDSLVRQHQRAVDQYNNNTADYNAMSRWERFKWTMKNPLARMSASHKTADTQARNLHNERIEQEAAALRPQAGDIGDAAYNPSEDLASLGAEISPDGEHVAGKREGYSDTTRTVKDKVLQGPVEIGASLASTGVGLLAPSAQKVAKDASKLTTGGRVAGVASGALQLGDAVLGAAGNTMDLVSSVNKGQRSEALATGLKLGQNVLSGASAGAKIAAYATPGTDALALAGGGVIPGLGVASGALQMGVGGVHLASGTSTRMAMSKRIAAMQEQGPLTRDQERMRRTFEQARGVAKIKQVQGGFEMGSGALQVTGNALTLGGVTAPVGALVSGAGTAVGLAGKVATSKMGKSLRTDTVEQELGLSQRIQRYREQHPEFSERDAKHIVLKSLGFATGKRKEAFQHITMRRARDLALAANGRGGTTAVNQSDAGSIIEDMGVHKKGGQYSLQGVAESLGMDRGTSWQDQMQETVDSRAANPFARAAAEGRESARKARIKAWLKK